MSSTPASRSSVQTSVRTAQILFIALLASQFVYAGVLRVILPQEEWTTTAFWPAQMEGLALILLVAAGLFWILASTLPVRLREAQLARLSATASQQERFGAVFTSLIIRWAMLEAIVLMGFVLSYVEKAPNYVLPLLGLAASSMLAGFPTAERMQAWAGQGDGTFRP